MTNSLNKKQHIISDSIYHYQFGMKTCYIYIYIYIFIFKKKRPSVKPFGLYLMLLFRYAKCYSLGCCQHPFVGLLESMWKKIFRRKPTIRDVTEYYFFFFFFPESSRPLTSSFPCILAGLRGT